MDLQLSPECKKDLLRYVRSTIGKALNVGEDPGFSEPWPVLEQRLGLFVTLNKKGSLRGCIGYIETDEQVKKSVGELAKSAAFRDPRFPPVAEEEFPEIEIEITILSKSRRIREIDEIMIGKHGLIISRGYNRGLLLPQVAIEYKMDVKEFLSSTCRKAGLHEDAWEEAETVIEIFEGYIFGEV